MISNIDYCFYYTVLFGLVLAFIKGLIPDAKVKKSESLSGWSDGSLSERRSCMEGVYFFFFG